LGYLGVDTSLSGRRWIGPDAAVERHAAALAQTKQHPPALCHVLARLGVQDVDVDGYLSPQLRDLLPDPRSLKDMATAAKRIVAAALGKQRVAVFADYDVDGGTSAAQLINWHRYFGVDCTLYVPDRIDEGYGPNPTAMSELAAKHDLIICVDCGTLSHEAIAAGHAADIIILDHHLGGETLPQCLAVVNPNRQDETGDLAHLCAAAVVFLTLVEARRVLRSKGTGDGPDLMSYLDLVGLATVADVAPLIGVNRAFVRQGLRVMARRERPGIVALCDLARVETAPTAYHLGFVLGPRINAGGRIGQADLGARLLASATPSEAQALAQRLDTLNSERREVENHVRDAALAQAEARGLDAPLVWAAGDGWHPGVVGIVASRLKEATNRPAIVIGFDGDDGKGSGRSVTGIDLGAQIQKLASEGHLTKGGGHKMAAGLSLTRAQLEPAMARLAELMARQGAGDLGPKDLRLDGILMPVAAQVELVELLEQAGPFGAGAAGPRFVMPEVKIQFAKRVGSSHLKLRIGDGVGASVDGICFGAFDTELGYALENHGGRLVHVAGRLDINTWQGRQSVQLRIEDAAFAGE
jgi:single-stranded-DNA-specific exonuclease